jgi:hypothetical protein
MIQREPRGSTSRCGCNRAKNRRCRRIGHCAFHELGYGRQAAVRNDWRIPGAVLRIRAAKSPYGGETQGAAIRLRSPDKSGRDARAAFCAWKESLLAGRNVSASAELPFSPVPLVEVCVALAELARNFQSGTFHISGDRDFSYFDAARRLASVLGVSESLVHVDKLGGSDLFDPVPNFGTLGIAAPSDCSRWRFSPSSDTLTGFLTSL